MMGILRDLPDTAVGLVLAATAWTGACYVLLAPRAMDKHLEEEVYPPCIEMLAQEQDAALSKAKSKLTKERSQAQSELSRKEREIDYLEQVINTYDQSGAMDLLGAFGVSVPNYSSEITAARQRVASLKAQLANLPDIERIRVPESELLKTCTCAAMEAVAGKRMNYAISLASFRLVSPAEISDVKQRASWIAGQNSCGAQPWRKLS